MKFTEHEHTDIMHGMHGTYWRNHGTTFRFLLLLLLLCYYFYVHLEEVLLLLRFVYVGIGIGSGNKEKRIDAIESVAKRSSLPTSFQNGRKGDQTRLKWNEVKELEEWSWWKEKEKRRRDEGRVNHYHLSPYYPSIYRSIYSFPILFLFAPPVPKRKPSLVQLWYDNNNSSVSISISKYE